MLWLSADNLHSGDFKQKKNKKFRYSISSELELNERAKYLLLVNTWINWNMRVCNVLESIHQFASGTFKSWEAVWEWTMSL